LSARWTGGAGWRVVARSSNAASLAAAGVAQFPIL
jgi:hypothetical protein